MGFNVCAARPPFVPVRLGREDIPGIVELERVCFAVPWTHEQFSLVFGHRTFAAYGIKAGAELAAYIAYAELTEEMEVFNLGVHPGHRRRGLAKALLGHVLARCAKLGISQGFLEVRASNQAAITLYGSFGFAVAGRRPKYYPDNGEDALIMSLDIRPVRR